MSDRNLRNSEIFTSCAAESFRFLVERFRFRFCGCSEDKQITCRYENDRVFVVLHYGPPGFEIDILLGRKGKEDQGDSKPFYIQDVLRYRGAQMPSGTTACSGSSIRACVTNLAEALRCYGGPFLDGADEYYEALHQLRRQDFSRWEGEMKVNKTKDEFTEAWRRQDYEEVVLLGQLLADQLRASDAKKVEYARKHL